MPFCWVPPQHGQLLLSLPPKQKPLCWAHVSAVMLHFLLCLGGKEHPGLLACHLGMTSLT